MRCKPPEDERYTQSKAKISKMEKRQKDAVRETRQFDAIDSIRKRDLFSTACLLTKVNDRHGLTDEELRFAVKGFLRCALTDDSSGKNWRRLFGVHKSHWIDHKTKEKHLADSKFREQLEKKDDMATVFQHWLEFPRDGDSSLPLHWRSRVSFRFFPSGAQAKTELQHCPLCRWKNDKECPLLESPAITTERCVPMALLNVQDVAWTGGRNKLSELLQNFLEQGGSPELGFELAHSCLPVAASVHARQVEPLPRMDFPLRITWRLLAPGPLFSGVDRQMIQALENKKSTAGASFDVDERASYNLQLRDQSGTFTHVIPLSSVKGIFRAGAAWLLERLAPLPNTTPWLPLTSDYGDQRRSAQKPCPLQEIFGGAGSEEREGIQGRRSLLRVYAERSGEADSCLRASMDRDRWSEKLYFARSIDDNSEEKAFIKIQAFYLRDGDSLVTEIDDGPQAQAALLTVCLVSDLISSGFFRLGGFTSRGFGIVRLLPQKVSGGKLFQFLEGNERELFNAAEGAVTSGFELAQQLGFLQPLEQLAVWIRQYLP